MGTKSKDFTNGSPGIKEKEASLIAPLDSKTHKSWLWEKHRRHLNFCQICFPPSGMDVLYHAVWGNGYFLLPGSKQHDIINAVDQRHILWNTEAMKSKQIRCWQRTRKWIEPWGRTVKVYCRACQMKANSFWRSLLMCVGKNSLEPLLSLSPVKGWVVKPAELERLQIFLKL